MAALMPECPATHHDDSNHLDEFHVCICAEIRAAVATDREMARRFANALLFPIGPNAELLKAAFDYLAATDPSEKEK